MNDMVPPVDENEATVSSPTETPEVNGSSGDPEATVEEQVELVNQRPSEQPYDNHTVEVSSGNTPSNINDPEGPDYYGVPTIVEKDFTYPTHADPQRYVDGHPHGVYLDDEMRRAAEVTRAKIEGREPDLVNPPAVQGTPLVPTGEVRKNLPGDYVVEPDKSLSVVVGVNESNLAGYGDAIHARKVEEANGQ